MFPQRSDTQIYWWPLTVPLVMWRVATYVWWGMPAILALQDSDRGIMSGVQVSLCCILLMETSRVLTTLGSLYLTFKNTIEEMAV